MSTVFENSNASTLNMYSSDDYMEMFIINGECGRIVTDASRVSQQNSF